MGNCSEKYSSVTSQEWWMGCRMQWPRKVLLQRWDLRKSLKIRVSWAALQIQAFLAEAQTKGPEGRHAYAFAGWWGSSLACTGLSQAGERCCRPERYPESWVTGRVERPSADTFREDCTARETRSSVWGILRLCMSFRFRNSEKRLVIQVNLGVVGI